MVGKESLNIQATVIYDLYDTAEATLMQLRGWHSSQGAVAQKDGTVI